MYGAGSIGRGFLGQLFSISQYKTCFLDVDQKIINLLNKENEYTLTIATPNGYKSEQIKNVYAVSGNNMEKASNEIATCEILATAVGANILKFIAPVIAQGIDKRKDPLNIIICENILDSGNYLKQLVKPYIKNIEFFEKNVGFIPASVGRMVPVIQIDNPLEVIVEPYNELQIDKAKIVGVFPFIKNIIPFSPFESMKKRKLFMHNMSHAICAYLGCLKGYNYIYESIRDLSINKIVNEALKESASALSKRYKIDYNDLLTHGKDLIFRYHNKYLQDTIKRVARDPIRKLKRNDRLVGAALFCLENDISPTNIIIGIKAALLYEKELSMSNTQLNKNEILYNLISKASLQDLNI